MKKIFILVMLVCLNFISRAQWPLTQNLGSDSTLISLGRNYGGAIKGNIINSSYADTTAANLLRIRQYAGGQIFTTGDTSLWLRSIGANKWVKLAGSSGAVNIYNSNGSFTGNRTASGSNLYSISFDAASAFRAESNTGTGKLSSLLVGTDSIFFQPNEGNFIIDSLNNLSGQNTLMGWISTAGSSRGKVGNVTIGTGLSLSNGVLNTSGAAGSNVWSITGNSGTTAGTNFLGTTDAVDLAFKTNNTEVARIFGNNTYRYRFGLDNIVTGNYSAAIGILDTASGNISFAAGGISKASGDYSVAIGYGVKSTGTNSFSFGNDNLSSNTSSMAFGAGVIASGAYSTATGRSDTASGDYSFVAGYESKASAAYSFAQGHEARATGVVSVAMGNNAEASGYAGISIGSGVRASGNVSTTFGSYYTNSKDTSVAIGFTSRKFEVSKDSVIISPTTATLISSPFQYTSGSPGAGKVLTSDASGNATWSSAPSAITMPINNLLAATGTNSIDNGNFTQTWNWPTLSSGAILINAASTAMTNSSYVFSAVTSGANASSGIETRAAEFNNTHTGTSSTNIALKLTASGGTTNYALKSTSGKVLIEDASTTGSALSVTNNTLTDGNLINITGTSTALASGNEGLNIGISGANATNGITATGARISVTNTNATSGTNVGLDLTASGATTANNALNIAAGAIALNGSAGTSGQVLTSAGANTLPTWSTPSSGITIGTTTITSGTDKRVLYNNSGVVGNAAGVEIGNTNERLTVTSQATSEAAIVAQQTGGNGYNALIIKPSDASNAYSPILRFKNTGGGGDAMFGQDYGVMQIDGSYAPGAGAADAEVRFGTLYNGINNVSIHTYVYGASSAPNNYTMKTRTPGTGVLGQVIQWGATGQTANLLEFRNNSGTGLSAFDANGSLGIGNVAPTSALHTTAFATAYAAKSANYTITAADYSIEVTANSPTITLPTAVGCTGRMYFITNSGAGTVTLATTSSQVFRNVSGTPTSLSLGTLTGVLVQSNNADWLKIASF